MRQNQKDAITYTILFICSGNSCRSAMAEGLLKKMLLPKYGQNVIIHSAGTLGIKGNPATRYAIDVAAEKGVDISNHISKDFQRKHIAEADIVFAMATNHMDYINQYFHEYSDNAFLLTTFYSEKENLKIKSIEDPIGQNLKTYRKVINIIEKELIRILPQVEQLIEAKFNFPIIP